ncbi:MAG: aminotransferase class I/II-fold pyridoxal phosphate-dependent enzyme [Longimicrobiales bacterium]
MTASQTKRDAFGNVVDSVVGYARGTIVSDSEDETLKNLRAEQIIRRRVAELGTDSIYVFTGMACDFPLAAEDLGALAQESVGPALFSAELREQAIHHMGGSPEDDVAVFNRTSGGIVAVCLALCSPGETIISLVPGAISHPSLKRGAELAGNALLEVSGIEALGEALGETAGSLVFITGVTSEQLVIPENDLAQAIELTREAGRVSLVDDAYGARVRTVLFGQRSALAAGADLAITSNQKAGLTGPRAGLLVGNQALVRKALSVATSFGQEARGPIALGVLRSLQRYTPERLLADVETGKALFEAFAAAFGSNRVSPSPLGPIIEQDDVLSILVQMAGADAPSVPLVPAEASAAVCMLLLEQSGILTANVAGAPGSRASLRLKGSAEDVRRIGGVGAVVEALDHALDGAANMIDDVDRVRTLLRPLPQPS